MSQKKQTSKDLEKVNAAQVETINLETINAATIPAPEEINNPVTPEITGDPQTDNQTETAPEEFQHMDNFPTLAEGLKFEVNGYKVTITGREYVKDGKWPWTAFNAVVIAPDGTEKTFTKVRNTAICNYCKSSTGITHNGNGERAITKVLSDTEIAQEWTRRTEQISGLLKRADELFKKYAGIDFLEDIPVTVEEAPVEGQEAQTEPAANADTNNTPEQATPAADNQEQPTEEAPTEEKKPRTLFELFTTARREYILHIITKDNNSRKESAEKAKAANAERTARKETRDLTAEISKLIAAGDFQKAAELMQQKANAAAAKEQPEQVTETAETETNNAE